MTRRGLGSGLLLLQAGVERPDRGLGAVAGVDFLQQSLDVYLHRSLSDVEFAGDHLVGLPGHQTPQDLNLSWREIDIQMTERQVGACAQGLLDEMGCKLGREDDLSSEHEP